MNMDNQQQPLTLYCSEKWTKSRGRYTQGYPIVTLKQGLYRGQVIGGGMDLLGLAWADLISSHPLLWDRVRSAILRAYRAGRFTESRRMPDHTVYRSLESQFTEVQVKVFDTVQYSPQVIVTGRAGLTPVLDLLSKECGITVTEDWSPRGSRLGWYCTVPAQDPNETQDSLDGETTTTVQ